MSAGRPSRYLPAYCDLVIETMATGLSLTAFAGEIGVSRETVNNWSHQFPEFLDAIKIAKAKRTLALEQKLLSSGLGPAVTSAIFALKNADPDEWRDRKELEVTRKVSADELNDDELAAIAAGRGEGASKAEKPPRKPH